ncbi:MAG: hypothetical protein GY916_03195 [Gammaproteobacteria bacterium]|nr:hypothetical protein [Gammaproteobacteria bacterium]
MKSQNRKILWTTIVSAMAATVILVTLVLPAEYGLDPLGTGEMLGVLGLSRPLPTAISNEEESFKSDTIRFELSSFQSVEYKYRLEQGASLVFSWASTGDVLYDLHAEPDGAERGFAESFDQGRSTGANGTYTAPFPGIHGWFWENRGSSTVVVDLITSGFYSQATEFRDGDQSDYTPREARVTVRP